MAAKRKRQNSNSDWAEINQLGPRTQGKSAPCRSPPPTRTLYKPPCFVTLTKTWPRPSPRGRRPSLTQTRRRWSPPEKQSTATRPAILTCHHTSVNRIVVHPTTMNHGGGDKPNSGGMTRDTNVVEFHSKPQQVSTTSLEHDSHFGLLGKRLGFTGCRARYPRRRS